MLRIKAPSKIEILQLALRFTNPQKDNDSAVCIVLLNTAMQLKMASSIARGCALTGNLHYLSNKACLRLLHVN